MVEASQEIYGGSFHQTTFISKFTGDKRLNLEHSQHCSWSLPQGVSCTFTTAVVRERHGLKVHSYIGSVIVVTQIHPSASGMRPPGTSGVLPPEAGDPRGYRETRSNPRTPVARTNSQIYIRRRVCILLQIPPTKFPSYVCLLLLFTLPHIIHTSHAAPWFPCLGTTVCSAPERCM